MSTNPLGEGVASGTLQGDERWELVGRIASTEPFRKSKRLREFLFFVAERSLTGRIREINEYEIGWRVFERQEDYNPGEDSIVRTSARQLRTKVKEYFDSEGLHEPLILEIPKGGYVPVFKGRDTANQVAVHPPSPNSALRKWQIAAGSLALVAVCSLLALLGFWRASKTSRIIPAAPTIVSAFLHGATQPTRIITGDYGAILMSNFLTRKQFSVEQYANRSYADRPPSPDDSNPRLKRMWDSFTMGQSVPLSNVTAISEILRTSGEAGKNVIVQQARHVTLRDLSSGNSILLDTPVGNPWLGLFQEKLNFQYHIEYTDDGGTKSSFENRNPFSGERALYSAASTTPRFGMTYGIIARLPNPSGDGSALLICGLRYTGTEGAAKYATDPKAAADLARRLNVDDISHALDFEVLLGMDSIDTTPRSVQVLSVRRISK